LMQTMLLFWFQLVVLAILHHDFGSIWEQQETERLGNRLVKTNDSISYADDNGRRSLILTSMAWKWSPPADFKSIECSSLK
jgi:hypothetical protein